MKKIIIALGLVLGLSGVSALQAQMRVYNENLVKFGNINTSPTLSSGLEVNMPNFLFKGNSAKFNICGYAIEFAGYSVSPASRSGATQGIVGPPVIELGPAIALLCSKNHLGIGSSTKPLHSLYATKLYSSSGGVSTISDHRYKTDIENLTPASDKIMQLRPVTFNYRDEKDGERSADPRRLNRVGLIAQELNDVIPEAVSYLKEDDIYTVDYTVLIPFLIKTAQEQQERIEALQAEIQKLKAGK